MNSFESFSGLIGINVNERQTRSLTHYLTILQKWNQHYSLTAVDAESMIMKHILDGMTIVPYINNDILDIGSGNGVPGIIIAIMLPEYNVYMIDSSRKKTAFLHQVKIELGLKNSFIINERVENYKNKFLLITARAVSSPKNIIRMSKHLLDVSGQYLLMCGSLSDEDMSLDGGYRCKKIDINQEFAEQKSILQCWNSQ